MKKKLTVKQKAARGSRSSASKKVPPKKRQSNIKPKIDPTWFSIISEHFPNGSISLVDSNLKFVFTGGSGYKEFGVNPESFIGKKLPEVLNKDAFKAIKKYLPGILKGKSYTQEIKLNDKYYLNSYRPVPSAKGKIKHFIITSQDITKLKTLEFERSGLLNVIQKSLNEIYIFDSQTLRFIYINAGALKNIGYTPDQMYSMTPVDIKPDFTVEDFQELIKPLRKGTEEKIVFETVHQRKDGSQYPVEVHLQLLPYHEEKYFVAIILDISTRRDDQIKIKERNEELATTNEELNATSEELVDQNVRLQELLHEKEGLFKELHHRIKNNLQTVISLLFLKSHNSNDDTLNRFINETKSRILSISLLHEQLLQLKSINKLDIHFYFKELVNNMVAANTTQENYQIVFDVDHQSLDVDKVVNLGLLTNEIISNIFKYAYPEKTGGKIELKLKTEGKNCRLDIADHGIGISNDHLKNPNQSYGLQLIHLFAQQLRAQLSIDNKKGTRYTLKFLAS